MKKLFILALITLHLPAIAEDRVPGNLDTTMEIKMPDQKAVAKERSVLQEDMQRIPETLRKLPNLDNLSFEKDPAALADLFENADSGKLPVELKEKQNQLMVFVSASLPEASLERIARDSEKYKASLILTGLIKGSFPETKAFVMRVGGYKWEVNPKAYEHFQIKTVPVTVVYDGDKWIGLPGDVSMEYALDKLSAQPGWEEIVGKMKS